MCVPIFPSIFAAELGSYLYPIEDESASIPELRKGPFSFSLLKGVAWTHGAFKMLGVSNIKNGALTAPVNDSGFRTRLLNKANIRIVFESAKFQAFYMGLLSETATLWRPRTR